MLDNVLGDLVRCSKSCIFAIIDTTPAGGELPDGRNLHLIREGKDWWQNRFNGFFKIGTILEAGAKLHCVLEPRKMGPIKCSQA
jgi:hypothetical protein